MSEKEMKEPQEINREQETQPEPQDNKTTDQQPEKTEEQPNQEQSTETASEEKTSEQEEETEEEEMVNIPKSRLEELETVEERALEQIKRERAEAINYRKRLQKQRDEFAEIASARVLTKLLAVQDDIKRILDNAAESIPKEHLDGIRLLSQRVEGIFESEGVALIKIEEGKTRYDPTLHEAVVTQPVEGVEPNTIIQIISQGFRKGDRVLRPAKVIISKQVTPPAQKSSDTNESQAESKEKLATEEKNGSENKGDTEETTSEKQTVKGGN